MAIRHLPATARQTIQIAGIVKQGGKKKTHMCLCFFGFCCGRKTDSAQGDGQSDVNRSEGTLCINETGMSIDG